MRINAYQFGFRKYLSTEISTAYFTDQIRKAMDNGQYTGEVYIDLSKDFDDVSHSILMNTLPEWHLGKGSGLVVRLPVFKITTGLVSRKTVICGTSILWRPSRVNTQTAPVYLVFQHCNQNTIAMQNADVFR